jgi:hypothetical protein
MGTTKVTSGLKFERETRDGDKVWVATLASGAELHKYTKNGEEIYAYDARGNYLGWNNDEFLAQAAAESGRMLSLIMESFALDLHSIWNELPASPVVSSTGDEIKALDDRHFLVKESGGETFIILSDNEMDSHYFDDASQSFDLKHTA